MRPATARRNGSGYPLTSSDLRLAMSILGMASFL
jgi:hypothetical protein